MKLSAISRADRFSSAFAPLPDKCIQSMNESHFNPRLSFLFVSNSSLTFPDKDLPVGAVVQDEAVVANQQLLRERALLRHFGHRHRPRGIRHLQQVGGETVLMLHLMKYRADVKVQD